ncbi:MAG: tRNA (N6-threonylcarbamoyladenosine(37)-N6)-methyltransferase TrmO [Candidatus Aminicenantes bacterium]|nr:tRNA (N6-threonylcarbamoyladenosine(37)-N6)-methyltransferase TrmO [Candidatus Aminicenantes bacterium]
MNIRFQPIGCVHSPYKTLQDLATRRKNGRVKIEKTEGSLEIFPEFEEGLNDIDGFSHLIIIFAFHQSSSGSLCAHPPHDHKKRGVFSTRSPHRPNPLGMTIVELVKREGNILKVAGIDMINDTPILDIKPYTPRDLKEGARFGWLEEHLKNT